MADADAVGEAKSFERWKYAEEHAADLHSAGRLFRITNAHGVRNTDGYLTDRFTVEDLGPVGPDSVGRTGHYAGKEGG